MQNVREAINQISANEYRETIEMGRELYQWQEECLKRWFANHGRGMVQAVTGSGKTLLALTAAGQ